MVIPPLSGQPDPMPDCPFIDKIFTRILSKPPLMQPEAISSHPLDSYLGEQTNPHLPSASFQVVVESDKVPPEPPFLQTKSMKMWDSPASETGNRHSSVLVSGLRSLI